MPRDKRIIHVFIVISLLFLSIVGYLSYFELFLKADIITNPYNKRLWAREDTTLRGKIYDRNGVVLVKSEMQGDTQVRVYPYGSLYSLVIGYNSKSYGKSLLEAKYNNALLNVSEFSPVLDLKNKLTGGRQVGNNLFLTIDNNLQQRAAQLLNGKKGAIVAINPKTGEVLAMVSKPGFDPNAQSLQNNWNSLAESEDRPLFPRATQGLYAPGSTFKVLISAAALEKGLNKQIFQDHGSVVIDGKTIRNFGGHAYGTLGLADALAVSSNVVFSQLGVQLGADTLKDITKRAGFEKDIPFDLPVAKSRFPYGGMSKTDLAAAGIGQGEILVTPLHMAMIAAGIANKGVIMRPYLVSDIVSPSGRIIWSRKPSSLYQVMDAGTAEQVSAMMEGVVRTGTGKSARISGVRVAGKTGTAENELSGPKGGKEHAWFIGFAPADSPQIAVAVILEYAGSTGGQAAAPMARELIKDWLYR